MAYVVQRGGTRLECYEGERRRPGDPSYGVVVDSVNVSVLLYVPVRNGSF